jgi:hypothetical protein
MAIHISDYGKALIVKYEIDKTFGTMKVYSLPEGIDTSKQTFDGGQLILNELKLKDGYQNEVFSLPPVEKAKDKTGYGVSVIYKSPIEVANKPQAFDAVSRKIII